MSNWDDMIPKVQMEPQNNWNDWSQPTPIPSPVSNPIPSNDPRDAMSEDQLLVKWDQIKKDIEKAKETEMEMRRYIVARAFPQKKEGMNNKNLGNGYILKAGIKYNYNLAENDKVENALDRIAKVGNHGSFIADRLVSWTPNFLVTEYRNLQEQADGGSQDAKTILNIITEVLTITDAAPTLAIKEPKAKK